MRLFTMLFLPLMLLGCGKAISTCDLHRPEGLDLSVLGLSDDQFEVLARRLAVPYYSAAAAAMFLSGLILSVFRAGHWLTLLLCILFYVVLQVGTLAYLCHVVKRK